MTDKRHFQVLDFSPMTASRDALHAYARVIGDWLKKCQTKRKHWWHASLRPSLTGLTSGIVHAETEFELSLDLRESMLLARTSEGAELSEGLNGQSSSDLAQAIDDFLFDNGIDTGYVPASAPRGADRFIGYSANHASILGSTLATVNAVMTEFRAGVREETSPIQLWPHHFDLSMIWLPGEKIAGQDPDDEENADKQMNFGFTFGDEGIPEPYFYVTAYPTPDGFPDLELPTGTLWQTDGFNGAVLLYRNLTKSGDPSAYLLDLWQTLLSAGQEQMLSDQHAD